MQKHWKNILISQIIVFRPENETNNRDVRHEYNKLQNLRINCNPVLN